MPIKIFVSTNLSKNNFSVFIFSLTTVCYSERGKCDGNGFRRFQCIRNEFWVRTFLLFQINWHLEKRVVSYLAYQTCYTDIRRSCGKCFLVCRRACVCECLCVVCSAMCYWMSIMERDRRDPHRGNWVEKRTKRYTHWHMFAWLQVIWSGHNGRNVERKRFHVKLASRVNATSDLLESHHRRPTNLLRVKRRVVSQKTHAPYHSMCGFCRPGSFSRLRTKCFHAIVF